MEDIDGQKVSSANSEVSLGVILFFLSRSYKIIFASCAVGFAIAVAYLMLAPKQYEAVAQIAMAKISTPKGANPNSSAINIEEPSVLIFRLLNTPASLTPRVLSSCGLNVEGGNLASVARSIKLSQSKYAGNMVELKVFARSPDLALDCATAVFDLIKFTQAQIAALYMEEVNVELEDYKERLKKAKALISRVEASQPQIGVTYLATRDEIQFLLGKIAEFEMLAAINRSGETSLVAPIYASDIPVAPKKSWIMLIGLIGGVFFGLLLAMWRQFVSDRDITKLQ